MLPILLFRHCICAVSPLFAWRISPQYVSEIYAGISGTLPSSYPLQLLRPSDICKEGLNVLHILRLRRPTEVISTPLSLI